MSQGKFEQTPHIAELTARWEREGGGAHPADIKDFAEWAKHCVSWISAQDRHAGAAIPLAADLLLYVQEGRVTKDLLLAYLRDRGIHGGELPCYDSSEHSVGTRAPDWNDNFEFDMIESSFQDDYDKDNSAADEELPRFRKLSQPTFPAESPGRQARDWNDDLEDSGDGFPVDKAYDEDGRTAYPQPLDFKKPLRTFPPSESSPWLRQAPRPSRRRIAVASLAVSAVVVFGAIAASYEFGSESDRVSEAPLEGTAADRPAPPPGPTVASAEGAAAEVTERMAPFADRHNAPFDRAPSQAAASAAPTGEALPRAGLDDAAATLGGGRPPDPIGVANPHADGTPPGDEAAMAVRYPSARQRANQGFEPLDWEFLGQGDRAARPLPSPRPAAALVVALSNEAGAASNGPLARAPAKTRNLAELSPSAGNRAAVEESRRVGATEPNAPAGVELVAPELKPIVDAPSEIRAMQRMLTDLGYDVGPTDGVYGPRTRTAIEGYQSRYGLPVDGLPTRLLANRLEASLLWQSSLQAFNRADYQEAILGFSKLITLRSDSADAVFNRGLSLQRAGRLVDAEVDFRAALELDPTHTQARLSLANVILEQGRYLDAAGQYLKTTWSWF